MLLNTLLLQIVILVSSTRIVIISLHVASPRVPKWQSCSSRQFKSLQNSLADFDSGNVLTRHDDGAHHAPRAPHSLVLWVPAVLEGHGHDEVARLGRSQQKPRDAEGPTLSQQRSSPSRMRPSETVTVRVWPMQAFMKAWPGVSSSWSAAVDIWVDGGPFLEMVSVGGK